MAEHIPQDPRNHTLAMPVLEALVMCSLKGSKGSEQAP